MSLLPGTERALLHRLAVAQSEGRTPSMVGTVVRAGQPVWHGARGEVDGAPPTPDTQYRIGSLTKTFVAVLVLRLRDEGRLDLGDPLEKHLPGTGVGALTVAQFLGHMSGLAGESPGPWWERTPGTLRPELADTLGERPERFPPGRRFRYSNPGYALLGALVEKLRGEPWGGVLRREVLEPLGMTRTTLLPEAPHARGWAVHPWADVLLPEPAQDTGRMAPAGQLWSTTADLARFASFLMHADDRVLRPDTLAEMVAPAAPPDADTPDSVYGLGTQLMRAGDLRLTGHTGSMPGFLAVLWVSAAEDVGAVVMANTTSGVRVGGLGAELVQIVADREPRIPDEWRPLPEVDPDLLALTGPWYWGPAAFTLRLQAGGGVELAPVNGPSTPWRFRPLPGGDGWVGENSYPAGETLRVVRTADGVVSHLDMGTFVLTRGPYEPADLIPGGVDASGWRGSA